jgi:hypothetical protein
LWIAILLTACVVSFPGTDVALRLGQPSAIAIGALLLGLWLQQQSVQKPAVVAFWVSLALKPQIGLPFMVYLILKRQRRAVALVAISSWLASLLVCALWLEFHCGAAWRHNLAANLAVALAPGGSNSPLPSNPAAFKFFNLQTVVALFTANGFAANCITWVVVAVLGVLWLMRATRTSEPIAISALAALALLPAYHLIADSPMLALLVPAIATIFMQSRKLAIAIGFCAGPSTFFYLQLHWLQLLSRMHVDPASLSRPATLLLFRELPLSLLLVSVMIIVVMYQPQKGTP